MNMIFRKALLLTLISAGVASADSYRQVYTIEQLLGELPGKTLYGVVADGKDVYSQFYGSLSSKPVATMSGITKIDSNGQWSALVGGLDWIGHAGTERMAAIYSFSESGENLYMAETGTDQVYSVNKNTGSISTVATVANMAAVTGMPKVSLLSPGDVYNGAMYLYEGESDSIIRAGVDGVSTVIASSGLLSLTGNTNVSGGLTVDQNGNMYWYGGDSLSIYSFNLTDGIGRMVLSGADIKAVNGGNTVAMGDIYSAPDGKIYFLDRNTGIMSFDPATAGTLSVLVSTEDLKKGRAGSETLYNFTWYDDNLAFCQMNTGFFVVPEPVTMLTLAAGGLAVVNRRKSGKN